MHCLIHVCCSSPKSSDEFVLQTDASGYGIGAVLSVMRDGEELPIGYFSRKLSSPERRYAATELECLAVVRSVEHFAVRRPFTDHRARTSIPVKFSTLKR